MPIQDLIPDRLLAPGNAFYGSWHAKFAKPAPTLLTDLVHVVIPDIDSQTLWGPCKWEPRVHTSTRTVTITGTDTGGDTFSDTDTIDVAELVLPSVGDECLVVFDNRRTLWVVSWWPS
jgi:hypothetical protein